MASSTEGSLTMTGWNRRSRAASFSIYWRYSLRVVAPMQCSSPRASMGLSRLPASMAALGLAGTHDGVQLVDEQDDPALRLAHLVQDGLQPLLKFAPVLGAGNQAAHVQGEDGLVFQARRARRP